MAGGHSVAPSRVSVGGVPSNSSAASGIFFQGDSKNQAPNSSMSGTARSGLAHVSGDINQGGPLNSTANSSSPNIGASSLVTDANSALPGRPKLQRSMSINNESYMRVPSSPMSFSSNNIQQNPHQEQTKQGDSINTTRAIKQEPGINFIHAQKKPRLDPRQDDVLQQQIIQQLFQRQGGHPNPQLNSIIQQQRHQILQSLPQMQRAPLMSQHLRPGQLQVQAVPPVRRSADSGLCARRLMQYMYHQRHRPPDNPIVYWRKFVAEYFAPRSKKRWCLSLYDNTGSQSLGAFPQAAMDAWQCDICGSKSGKGFEATYEVLPRLNQIKFDRGIVDEILFLDMPHEGRLPSGIMVLEYAKAVQESVYEQIRVVREGQLRITFTPDLKILSWDFCARRHEEFFSRRAIAPQVNQLLQVAQKYQTAVNESGTAGLPSQDLQANCNMFMTAGHQLVKSLELPSLNELGFSKRYVRCLQISEVVNGMKDLMEYSQENKIGPIESLKSYTLQASAKLQTQKMQEMEQTLNTPNLSADQSTLNKIMAMHPVLNGQIGNNPTAAQIVNNSPHNSFNQQYLSRVSSTPTHDQPPSSFNTSNQTQPAPSLTKTPSSNSLVPKNNGNLQPAQVNHQLEQQVIQQLLQDMMNKEASSQPPIAAPNTNHNGAADEAVGPVKNELAIRRNNNNSSSSSSSFSGKSDLLQNLHFPELDQDILREFAESGIQW